MTTRYKARGIVLGTVKYGENALIAHLLTDLYGRQSYIIQGIRSTRGHGSKMAYFQPLSPIEFDGISTTRSDLHRMAEIHSGMVLDSIPFDVRKSTISLFMAEAIYRLFRDSEPNGDLFDFIWGSVEALDSMTEGVSNFHLWFLATLSRFLGFSPGNEYRADAWFDMREGVYTESMPLHDFTMSPFYAMLLRDLHDCDVDYLAEIALNRTQRVEMLELLMKYYTLHLERVGELKSINILREVF